MPIFLMNTEQMFPTIDYDSKDIPTLLDDLEVIYRDKPEYRKHINHELKFIVNKCKTIPESEKMPVGDEESAVSQEILSKIQNIVGKNFKIPDLRSKATEWALNHEIPLLTAARNHKDMLLVWINDNWDIILDDIKQWKNEKPKKDIKQDL